MMQTLTLNNQQLLFVRVPMEAGSVLLDSMGGISALIYRSGHVMNKYMASNSIWLPKGEYELLGTIQKSNGVVSTTIPDEVLAELTGNSRLGQLTGNLSVLLIYMDDRGLILQEDDKYVILKTE